LPSAIGDVQPALVALVTAAVTPTKVYGGPKPINDTPTEYVTVGFDPANPDTDGVTTDQDISTMGNDWVEETGDVTCAVTVWTGGTDTAPLIQRADDLLDLIDAALKADPHLGGVLVPASNKARVLGKGALRQASTANGAVAVQTFTIHYTQLLVG
jgi:hypothetical protein